MPWIETEEGYEYSETGTLPLPQAPDWSSIPSYIPADDETDEGEPEEQPTK